MAAIIAITKNTQAYQSIVLCILHALVEQLLYQNAVLTASSRKLLKRLNLCPAFAGERRSDRAAAGLKIFRVAEISSPPGPGVYF